MWLFLFKKLWRLLLTTIKWPKSGKNSIFFAWSEKNIWHKNCHPPLSFFVHRVSGSWYFPWILKLVGLESSSQRLISLNSKTKRMANFFDTFFLSYLADPGEARGSFTNSFVIKVSKWWFVKISLRRRHALMVDDGAFSHKIDHLTIV